MGEKHLSLRVRKPIRSIKTFSSCCLKTSVYFFLLVGYPQCTARIVKNIFCLCVCSAELDISSSASSEAGQEGADLPVLLASRGVYCPHSCVCVAVRRHTVFNGRPPPSRIFLSECVGGCCADVRDRQIEEGDRGRVRNRGCCHFLKAA